MSNRSFDSPPHNDRPTGIEDDLGQDQEAIVTETDVAAAGRSCLALLALFAVIFLLFVIWFLYRSTT